MAAPPLPQGFKLDTPDDPLAPLLAAGVEPTNGYRTKADIARLRAEGYTPASNSDHLRGDAVDLTPGKSGWSLKQLEAEARKVFGPGADVSIHNGTHVHASLPGWGEAPGTPGTKNFGLPPLPAGFTLEQRGSLSGAAVAPRTVAKPTSLRGLSATGQAHDGDTIRLSDGRDGRLFGYDAYETGQMGRRRDGSLAPLGTDATNYITARLVSGQPVDPTGAFSYGRPIINLTNDPNADPARDAIRLGFGLAAPRYLRGTSRFPPYMEAERQARMNFLGGHATNAESPEQFRHKDGPWQGSEPGKWGEGQAVFWDEPSPTGLRPEIEQAYNRFSRTAKSADELIAYGKENGFEVPREAAEKFIADRTKAGGRVGEGVYVVRPPRPMIDPGDGRFGTFMRGVGDPVNLIDELGGIVDAVGGTRGRENLWNSQRRFGDILWNNIDQNRDILAHDDEAHPFYRLGGQIGSAFVVPAFGAETALGRIGLASAEGALAGFGAGEGGVRERLPSTALGTVLGATGGAVLGVAGKAAGPLLRRIRAFRRPGGSNGADSAVARAAMSADPAPSIAGPPLPEGFKIDAPFGMARNVDERLSAEQMAKLAEGVDPASVLPRPASSVQDLDEAIAANPGSFAELAAPEERDVLSAGRFGKATVRGPLDVTQQLRAWGGVKDTRGDLAHSGVSNKARTDLDFGRNEGFIGRLIDDDNGMQLDEAAERLWEAGYFPGRDEAPTANDLIDILSDEARGKRTFHPDDLAEVADFHATRDERYRVEQARQEGSPLVEERGHTINLDDLVANTPPASAYEDAPRLTGKIGNINLDRLEQPEQVAQLIDQVSKRVGGFDAAARGKVTHEETQRLAADIGLRPEQLLTRRQSQALNAEQLYAARALVQASRQAVARLAQKAVGGSDDQLASFRAAWLKHVALEEQIAGATAEAGRAMSQFRMLASARDAGADAVRSYLKGAGGRDEIEEAAQSIVDLIEDPARASHFMREAVKPRWRDKFNELWVNSLLSGPRTHIVNFVGNALTTALSLPETAMTAAIGKVTRSADRAALGEIGARAAGLADSSVDALRAMQTAFRTGEPLDHVAKVEARNHEAIGGVAGKIIRTPTRALTAADEFWKTLLSSGELRQLAYRQALREAAGGEGFAERYAQLTRNPTDEMMKAARESARYFTFQAELGEAGRHIQGFANNALGGKLVLPFVRTPINIIKFAGERSAFGLAMPEVRAALKAGGRARDEALGRILLGSGLSTAAVVAAIDGRLSGSGPSDPRERAALMQAGWQPNSIKIGNQWVSYGRFDPVATLLGVAADFAEAGQWATRKEADEVALGVAKAIAKNITNKTWLSGLSDAFEVLTDPDRYGKAYIQKMASSLAVPAISAQTAQAIDPELRDARTIVDAIKSRVPVVSKGVPVRRNVWGDPITRGDAIGPDILSPFFATRASLDPVNREIGRLSVPLSMPDRSLTIGGEKIALDASQYDELVQLSGRPAKQFLRGLIRSKEWSAMTDAERIDTVKEALSDFRKAARETMKGRLSGQPATLARPNSLQGLKRKPRAKAPPLPPGYALETPAPLPDGFVLDNAATAQP